MIVPLRLKSNATIGDDKRLKCFKRERLSLSHILISPSDPAVANVPKKG